MLIQTIGAEILQFSLGNEDIAKTALVFSEPLGLSTVVLEIKIITNFKMTVTTIKDSKYILKSCSGFGRDSSEAVLTKGRGFIED